METISSDGELESPVMARKALTVSLAMLAELQLVTEDLCKELQDVHAETAFTEMAPRRSAASLPRVLSSCGIGSRSLSRLTSASPIWVSSGVVSKQGSMRPSLERCVARLHAALTSTLEPRVRDTLFELEKQRKATAGLQERLERQRSAEQKQLEVLDELQRELDGKKAEALGCRSLQKELEASRAENASLQVEVQRLQHDLLELRSSPKAKLGSSSWLHTASPQGGGGPEEPSADTEELQKELQRATKELKRQQTHCAQKDSVIEGLREAVRALQSEALPMHLSLQHLASNAPLPGSSPKPDVPLRLATRPTELAAQVQFRTLGALPSRSQRLVDRRSSFLTAQRPEQEGNLAAELAGDGQTQQQKQRQLQEELPHVAEACDAPSRGDAETAAELETMQQETRRLNELQQSLQKAQESARDKERQMNQEIQRLRESVQQMEKQAAKDMASHSEEALRLRAETERWANEAKSLSAKLEAACASKRALQQQQGHLEQQREQVQQLEQQQQQQELEQQRQQLEQQLGQLKEELERAQQQLIMQQQQSLKDIEFLKDAGEKQQLLLRQTKQETLQLQEEKTQLATRVAQLEEANERLQQELAAKTALSEKSQQLKEQQLQQQLQLLQTNCETFRNTISLVEADAAAGRHKAVELERELATLREDVEKRQARVEELESSLADALKGKRQETAEREALYEATRHELQAEQERYRVIFAQAEAAKQQQQQLERLLHDTQQEALEHRSKCQELAAQVTRLEKQLCGAEAERAEREEQTLQEMRRRKAAAAAAATAAAAETRALEAKLDAALRELEEHKQQLDRQAPAQQREQTAEAPEASEAEQLRRQLEDMNKQHEELRAALSKQIRKADAHKVARREMETKAQALENKLELRRSQVQTMLELNEAICMEKEEILSRATDMLRKARGDCIRLGQVALMRKGRKEVLSPSTRVEEADINPLREYLKLSSFGSSIFKELEWNLNSQSSDSTTSRCMGTRRNLRQVAMYRPVALNVHDLAPGTHGSLESDVSSPRAGDLLNMFPNIPNPLDIMSLLGKGFFHSDSSGLFAKQQQAVHSSSSNSSDGSAAQPFVGTPPRHRTRSTSSLQEHKDSADRWEPRLSSSESGLDTSGRRSTEVATAETIPTLTSITTDDRQQQSQKQPLEEGGSEISSLPPSSSKRNRVRRRPLADQYIDVENRRFLAYSSSEFDTKSGS